MLCLEESPHHQLLDLGESGQLAEGHHAQELPLVHSTLAKLEETGTVDRLHREREKVLINADEC